MSDAPPDTIWVVFLRDRFGDVSMASAHENESDAELYLDDNWDKISPDKPGFVLAYVRR